MSDLLKAIPATVDPDGTVHLSEHVKLSGRTRAIVTFVLDDTDAITRASEASLAKDWNRREEDEAWSSLQEGI